MVQADKTWKIRQVASWRERGHVVSWIIIVVRIVVVCIVSLNTIIRLVNYHRPCSLAQPYPSRQWKTCVVDFPMARYCTLHAVLNCCITCHFSLLSLFPFILLQIGMLNDNRKFDYRIKCSFSFVSHSILDFSRNRSSTR